MAPLTGPGPARPDTEVVFDPATYTGGVPFEALARLRRETPVAWVPEIPVLGWPEGPGFWLVLGHANVESVLRRPELFSSALGATQIRDPATPEALSYVRRMMLNMDPPEHSRLRRLLSRSFTPRAVARLEDRIRGHARAICDRVFTGPRGECDFAKDVAADLPLLALADVLGVPEQDRWLLFDWSNRVIGYQDPDYASSSEFDPAAGTAMAREALAERPSPGPGGRMPDPRTREGMPDLYAYAHLLAEEKRRRPGDDVMSILLAQSDEGGARVSVAEFENMFWLFAVAGNETLRNGLPGACIALLEHPRAAGRVARRSGPAVRGGRRDAALVDAGDDVPADRGGGLPDRRPAHPFGGQGRGLLHLGQPRRGRLRRPRPVRHPPPAQPAPGVRPRTALLPGRASGPYPDARAVRRGTGAHVRPGGGRPPAYLRSNFQRGVKRLPLAWAA